MSPSSSPTELIKLKEGYGVIANIDMFGMGNELLPSSTFLMVVSTGALMMKTPSRARGYKNCPRSSSSSITIQLFSMKHSPPDQLDRIFFFLLARHVNGEKRFLSRFEIAIFLISLSYEDMSNFNSLNNAPKDATLFYQLPPSPSLPRLHHHNYLLANSFFSPIY